MVKHSNHRMQAPKGVQLPLSDVHQKWFYQEIVVRFGEYKDPIRSVHQLEKSLGIPWWEIVKVVELDKHHTFLATDRKHVWAVNRCSKVSV